MRRRADARRLHGRDILDGNDGYERQFFFFHHSWLALEPAEALAVWPIRTDVFQAPLFEARERGRGGGPSESSPLRRLTFELLERAATDSAITDLLRILKAEGLSFQVAA